VPMLGKRAGAREERDPHKPLVSARGGCIIPPPKKDPLTKWLGGGKYRAPVELGSWPVG